ncbi:phage protease [Nevskia sp.]|uniref:phage protease n=1 Tax=Nevskia sp. TaxID=1929292 RepID=UPI003F6EBE2F
MSKARRLTALCFALPAGATAEAAPARIPVIPAPDAQGRIVGADGRQWRLSRPAQVAASATRPIPIDENHSTQLAAPAGQAAPAFGWVSGLAVDADGGISGPADWNPRGLNAYANRDYRYLSPVIEFDAATGEIVGVRSVALTNNPNFPSLALNAAQAAGALDETLPMPALNKLLQLPDAASEADQVIAVQALIDAKATALNAASHPPLDKFVPRADHELALNTANQARTAAETALATERKTRLDAETNSLIEQALQDGKITPGTVEYHRANCARQGGLDAFRTYLSTAPVVAPESAAKGQLQKTGVALNAEQLSAMTAMGVDEAAFRKANGL